SLHRTGREPGPSGTPRLQAHRVLPGSGLQVRPLARRRLRPVASVARNTMASPDIPLRKIDHVRFFVGNARQSAFFYRNAFGFDVLAYAGLETKVRHEAGYVLKQGEITFVLTSPLSKEHPESQRLITHGDGVMDIALDVPDVRGAFELAVSRGA